MDQKEMMEASMRVDALRLAIGDYHVLTEQAQVASAFEVTERAEEYYKFLRG